MATTLWHVEVFKLAGNTVRLAVQAANADAGPFETSKTFVLRMLYEPAAELNADYQRVALGPLGDAIDDDKIDSDSWLAAHGDGFIKSVELSNTTNGDVTRDSSQAEIEQELVAEGKAKASSEWDELVHERMVAFWSDPKTRPSTVYTIEATDPKWLSHLTPGQKWGSAAYV